MLTLLVEHARSSGVKRLIVIVQPDNTPMRSLLLAVCPRAYILRRQGDVSYAVDLG